MAAAIEKGKKAKAPAKSRASAGTARKSAVKRRTVAQKVKATTPTHDEIAELARRYWAERGWKDGHAEQDWLRAERALMAS